MDMGCHLVDTARYLFGEIQSVTATTGRFGKYGVGEDAAMLTVGFASGALGWFDMTWCANPESARLEWVLNETVAEGNAGSLRLMTDGSLEFTSLTGVREPKPGRASAGRAGLLGRLHHNPAPFHRRPCDRSPA